MCMENAVAFTDNDVAVVAWSYGAKPVGCMGFALYRIDETGAETPLPSHAVFKGYKIEYGQTTKDFPVQKFYWKDPYARLIAERTGKRRFRYKVVPLDGIPGDLEPMTDLPTLTTNEVEISPEISKTISAFFNRGLISTQRVSRALKGKPDKGSLLALVSDPQDPLRASLSGDMVEALLGFLDRAKSTGKIYAALYELSDDELIQRLGALGDRLEIVLSTQPAWGQMEQTAGEKHRRIMPAGHIGHNKFLVHVDGGGKPKAVLLGSTNWTTTGLCTQTNNTLVIEDAKLAKRYLDYWKQLAADTEAAAGDAKKLQGATLRTWDAKDATLKLGAASVESWFSPNTPKARGRYTKDEKRPPDMEAIVERIDAAKHAILFLAFYPGTPSIANWTAAALRKNKDLFVRGCVTNKSASEGFYYELKGTTPPPKVPGAKTPVRQDPRVIGAEALDDDLIPEGWLREILSAGFAIIHDKILVIDPFSDNCVVVTGSHNLGHKASYDNDENLVIVEGNKQLAMAYATHVLDVYDHFSWRYQVKLKGTKDADQSLAGTPDEWLAKYFDQNGQIKNAQLKFWMQAAGN
jgi:hypothetical protein